MRDVNTPKWWAYFRDVAGTEDGATIAEAAGVTPSQVSRWKSGKNQPDAAKMVRFARYYGRPPLEALIAGGFITAEEASAVVEIKTPFTDAELVAQIAFRLNVAPDDPELRGGRIIGSGAIHKPGVRRDEQSG